MTIEHYGASPEAWNHFDLVLELGDDLLPVVSDPTAEISPKSKMKDLGKTPSLFNHQDNAAGIKDWTSKIATAAEISKWSKDNRLGICLQTRVARAIDVDVGDFEEAVDIEDFIAAHLGFKLPIRRRSNSTKFLMLFKLPGDMPKRKFSTKTEGNFIEFLATGQQCIVQGRHTSGSRYEFDGGLPDKIPALTLEEFETLWATLHARFGSEESVTARAGVAPSIKRRLEDINCEVVTYMDGHWPIHDIADDGRVDVTCPWESGHSMDSGPTATSWYPAGVGGFARGHFKCLHASCAHRTDQDFLNEIGYNADGFEIIEAEPVKCEKTGVSFPRPDLPKHIIFNLRPPKKGQKPGTETVIPVANAIQAAVQEAYLCGQGIIHDTFRDEIMITNNIVNRPLHEYDLSQLVWRPLRDTDYHKIKMRLETGETVGYKFESIAIENVRQSVRITAESTTYDSLTSYAERTTWDGVARIAYFLRDFMGADDTEYTRAVSLYYWTALAGRALVPGIKADMVPIAVGKQGARKTTLIRAIAPNPDMFVELDLSKSDADLARDMRGKIVGELGEMKGLSAKMVEHVKSFITRQREEWTPKFMEYTVKYLRRCVFFGTTNDNEPLPPDGTGQRRWLPFRVQDGATCSVEQLIAIRDQLWAEAVELFRKRGVMWQDAERLATNEHRDYEKVDPWVEHLRGYIFDDEMGDLAPIHTPGGLKLNTVISEGLSIHIREINNATYTRAAACMRALGLKNVNRNGRVWVLA